MGSNKRGTRKRGIRKRSLNKRGGSNKKVYNRNNKQSVSRKRRKTIRGGGFIDSVKTNLNNIVSKVTNYFKPKDAYSIESFEGHFNTLFD